MTRTRKALPIKPTYPPLPPQAHPTQPPNSTPHTHPAGSSKTPLGRYLGKVLALYRPGMYSTATTVTPVGAGVLCEAPRQLPRRVLITGAPYVRSHYRYVL